MQATATAAPLAIVQARTCMHCPQPTVGLAALCDDCRRVADHIEATFPAPRDNWSGIGRKKGAIVNHGALTMLLDPYTGEVIAWGIGDPAALQPMTVDAARDLGDKIMVDGLPPECQDDADAAIHAWHIERAV